MSEVLTGGHEFTIGKRVYMIQRSLTDNGWDVNLPIYGWQSTGFPLHCTAAEAENMFRSNIKGGAKKWMSRRRSNT